MTLSFENIATSHLAEAVGSAATVLPIKAGDYHRFLGTGFMYAKIRSAEDMEIVKIDRGASTINGLSVSRGQGGTTAVPWLRGTLILEVVSAEVLGLFEQQEDPRIITYNPNTVLTPTNFGEKVYQSDLQLWWKASSATEKTWMLIVGVMLVSDPTFSPGGGSYGNGQTVTLESLTAGAQIRYTLDGTDPTEESALYSDPFELPDDSTTTVKAKGFHPDRWMTPSGVTSAEYTTTGWVTVFDNTKWTVSGVYGTWDGAEWDSYRDTQPAPDPYDRQVVSLISIGTWMEFFRPSKIRITHDYAGGDLYLGLANGFERIVDEFSCASGEEVPVTFITNDDIRAMEIRHGNGVPAFSVTNIEFKI